MNDILSNLLSEFMTPDHVELSLRFLLILLAGIFPLALISKGINGSFRQSSPPDWNIDYSLWQTLTESFEIKNIVF